MKSPTANTASAARCAALAIFTRVETSFSLTTTCISPARTRPTSRDRRASGSTRPGDAGEPNEHAARGSEWRQLYTRHGPATLTLPGGYVPGLQLAQAGPHVRERLVQPLLDPGQDRLGKLVG